MGFYDDMQDIASDVIGEFEQGTVGYVTLTPVAGATPDAPGTPTETVTTINATVSPVWTKHVDGTHVVVTDKMVVTPAGVVTPDMDDQVRIDGVDHKIVRIRNIPEAGTAVVHHIIVRR